MPVESMLLGSRALKEADGLAVAQPALDNTWVPGFNPWADLHNSSYSPFLFKTYSKSIPINNITDIKSKFEASLFDFVSEVVAYRMNRHERKTTYHSPSLVVVGSLGAERHFTVQKQQRFVEVGVEGEAEPLPVGLGVGNREVSLRVVLDRVVRRADVLDQGVVRRDVRVGVGRDETGLDHEP